MAENKNYSAPEENEEMETEMTVTLTLDDGSELECVVLTIFEEGEREDVYKRQSSVRLGVRADL